MTRIRLTLALALTLGLAACDADELLPADPASSTLRVAGPAHLGLDTDGRPHMTAGDATARLELPVTTDRADLLFQAVPADDSPLMLTWQGGPRAVRFSSWAANGTHDLRLDLRRAGVGPATLRVFDGDLAVAEAPLPTGAEIAVGSAPEAPTSVHIFVTENGDKIVVYDYDLAPGGDTSLSSPLLGLRGASVTHLAVALPPEDGADHRDRGVLSVEGAREITVFDAQTH